MQSQGSASGTDLAAPALSLGLEQGVQRQPQGHRVVLQSNFIRSLDEASGLNLAPQLPDSNSLFSPFAPPALIEKSFRNTIVSQL
jgi:hypothetical protein